MSHSFQSSLVARSWPAIVLGLAVAAADARAEEVAFVLDTSGEWSLVGTGGKSQPLAVGDALPAGAIVRRSASAGADDALVVTLYTGAIVRYEQSPATLPERFDPAKVSPIWQRVRQRYQGRKVQLLRGAKSKIADDVVQLTGETLELSSALAALPAGRYAWELKSLAADDVANAPTAASSAPLELSPAQNVRLAVGLLTPGLYRLSVRRIDSTDVGAATAVLLVVGRARYPAVAAEYHSAVELTRSWGNDASPSAVRTFLRAYLESLAEKPTSGDQGP